MRVWLCGVLSLLLSWGAAWAEEAVGEGAGEAALTVLTQVTFRTVTVVRTVPDASAAAGLARSWKPWVLPGLGHADVGEARRGAVLMGLFGCCVVGAAVLEVSARSAYAEHRRLVPLALAEPDLDRRRVLMEAAVSWYDRYTVRHAWAQSAAVAAGVVWAYGLFDYFEALRRWRGTVTASAAGVVVGWRRSW